MKKKDLITGIVGIILILAMVLGLVVFLVTKDITKTTSKDTTATDTSAGSDNDSTAIPPSFSNYYIDSDGVGFVTEDGVTTFFYKLTVPSAIYLDVEDDADHSTAIIKYDYIKYRRGASCRGVGSSCHCKKYELDYKYSFDGYAWNELNPVENSKGDIIRYEIGFDPGTVVLFSITTIKDCQNPMNVYSDINSSVLGHKEEYAYSLSTDDSVFYFYYTNCITSSFVVSEYVKELV